MRPSSRALHGQQGKERLEAESVTLSSAATLRTGQNGDTRDQRGELRSDVTVPGLDINGRGSEEYKG